MHLPWADKMERASQRLNHRFLDRPEQGRCPGRISPRELPGKVQFLVVKNPAQGVITLEFVGRCHIDADIGPIPTKSGPDLPVPRAEGNGWSPNFSQQELRPAQQTVSHLKGNRSTAK
jgi:hypothetical protein